MTNGLFDPSFRGAGSPGSPGVGSTQRGLQLVAQGRNTLQQQGLGLESQREARVGERDQARLQSLIRGATLLKQIQDPRQKIEFLRGRVGELRRAGISSSDSEEALSLAEAGDFAGLEQVTDEAIALGRGAQESFTLSPGQTRFQGATPIAFGGLKPEELSGVQKKVLAEGIDPTSPAGQQRARELNQRAATSPGLRSDLEVLNKANKDQLLASGFANRVVNANKDFIEIENKPGFDPTAVSAVLLQNIPGGNIALSEDQQLYQRSKIDFITSVLRLESGAAIGAGEFEKEDKKFFPQPGDKPKVIIAKRKARDRAFQNLKNQSKGVFEIQFKESSEDIPAGLPKGTINNNDGTFTLPTGERVEPG